MYLALKHQKGAKNGLRKAISKITWLSFSNFHEKIHYLSRGIGVK